MAGRTKREYTELADMTVGRLLRVAGRQYGNWLSLIRQLAPVEMKDEDLPQLSIQNLLKEAILRLWRENECYQVLALRLGGPNLSLANMQEVLSGRRKPLSPMSMQNILCHERGDQNCFSQLHAVLTNAAAQPRRAEEKKTSEEPEMEWTDARIEKYEAIARTLGRWPQWSQVGPPKEGHRDKRTPEQKEQGNKLIETLQNYEENTLGRKDKFTNEYRRRMQERKKQDDEITI